MMNTMIKVGLGVAGTIVAGAVTNVLVKQSKLQKEKERFDEQVRLDADIIFGELVTGTVSEANLDARIYEYASNYYKSGEAYQAIRGKINDYIYHY